MKLNHILLTLFCNFVTFFTAFGMERNNITPQKSLAEICAKQTSGKEFNKILDQFKKTLAAQSKTTNQYKTEQQEQKQKKQTTKSKKRQNKQLEQKKENLLLEEFMKKANDERKNIQQSPSVVEKQSRKDRIKELKKEKKLEDKKIKNLLLELTLKKIAYVNKKREQNKKQWLTTKEEEETKTYLWGKKKGLNNVVHGENLDNPGNIELPDTYLRSWREKHEELHCPGIQPTESDETLFFSLFDKNNKAHKKSLEEFMAISKPCCPEKYLNQIPIPDTLYLNGGVS